MQNDNSRYFSILKAASYLAITLMVASIGYAAVLSITLWQGISV